MDTKSLAAMAKVAIDNQEYTRNWGREAIRLIVEDGRSVESIITETKEALAWHYHNGILDTPQKKAKFNNYFSTIRYLIPGWASGSIPLDSRNAVLNGTASFLYVYAQQKKLEKAEASSFDEAMARLAWIKLFVAEVSPANAERLKQEIAILLEAVELRLSMPTRRID
jgi:hypothetical protein